MKFKNNNEIKNIKSKDKIKGKSNLFKTTYVFPSDKSVKIRYTGVDWARPNKKANNFGWWIILFLLISLSIWIGYLVGFNEASDELEKTILKIWIIGKVIIIDSECIYVEHQDNDDFCIPNIKRFEEIKEGDEFYVKKRI